MLLPHKEERFLYPVYQSICISASIGLSRVTEGVFSSRNLSKRLRVFFRERIMYVWRHFWSSQSRFFLLILTGFSPLQRSLFFSLLLISRLSWLKHALVSCVVGVIILLSMLRVDALLLNYGGSLKAWKVVHELTTETSSQVCRGARALYNRVIASQGFLVTVAFFCFFFFGASRSALEKSGIGLPAHFSSARAPLFIFIQMALMGYCPEPLQMRTQIFG